MALAVALARPELKVLGITAVAGNASLPKTYENLRRTLALLGAGQMRAKARYKHHVPAARFLG